MKQQLFTPNASQVSDTLAMTEQPMEILPPNAVEAMARAEIDIQISTAHRFPRSLAGFKKRAVDMVTIDEETALSCIYSRPVGMKNGKQTYAEGLSVRMAEIVGAAYGNLRVGATLIEQTERFVRARGYAHDLEANFAATSEVIESTVKRDGTPYDERMRIVIAKACLAKALRDATFKVVPRALCKPVENEAKRIAIGDAKTLETRRKAMFEWVSKLNVAAERVFAALGVEGEEDIGVDELKILLGLHTAIKDGEVSVDEAFPRIVAKAATPKRLKKEEPTDDGATVPVQQDQQ
jgi:hypothetical protein